MQNKEYFNWIDILKGLGIILVILGHLRVSHDLLNYIYLFHMPLFFFISGYLMDVEKYNSINQLVKKKTKSLLVPYITFSIISIICYSVFGEIDIDLSGTVLAFLEGKRNEIFYNVPLWFLLGLFVIEIMYFVFKKIIRNNIALLFLVILLNFVAVVVLKVIETPKWIWSIDTALYYLLYYQLGNLFKMYYSKINIKNTFNKMTIGIIVFLCVSFNLILLISPDQIQFVYNYVNVKREFLFIWLMFCGITGIVTYVSLSMFIKQLEPLEYLGRNSLIIFTLHYPIGIWAVDMLKVHLQFNIINSNVLSIVQLIFILLILKPIIKIINENFPILLGKGKFLSNKR